MNVGFASRPFKQVDDGRLLAGDEASGRDGEPQLDLAVEAALASDLDCVLEDRPLDGGALVDHDDRLARAQGLRRRDRSVQHEVGEVAQSSLSLPLMGSASVPLTTTTGRPALGGNGP